jgi:hypothetical protein
MAISKDPAFSECVIMDEDVFDPDAVFLDDIVDDEVLPKLSLAVDGLTTPLDRAGGNLDMPSEDTAANQVSSSSTTLLTTTLGPEQLEVYGWESSLWRKIRGYLGF